MIMYGFDDEDRYEDWYDDQEDEDITDDEREAQAERDSEIAWMNLMDRIRR